MTQVMRAAEARRAAAEARKAEAAAEAEAVRLRSEVLGRFAEAVTVLEGGKMAGRVDLGALAKDFGVSLVRDEERTGGSDTAE